MNEESLGFLPAIPFLIYVLYAAYRWERFFLKATILVLLICLPLYGLKKMQSSVFRPVIGRHIVLMKGACLNIFRPENQEAYVFLTSLGTESVCDSTRLSGADEVQQLNRGYSFRVDRVEALSSGSEMTYVIHSYTDVGHLRFSRTEQMVWDNGEKIVPSDFHREIFTVPAELMKWTEIPAMIYQYSNSF